MHDPFCDLHAQLFLFLIFVSDVPLASQWTPASRRVGAIAVKLGMMTLEDEWGARFPVTVLQLQQNQVTQVWHRIIRLECVFFV
jgi:hypothetical protein